MGREGGVVMRPGPPGSKLRGKRAGIEGKVGRMSREEEKWVGSGVGGVREESVLFAKGQRLVQKKGVSAKKEGRWKEGKKIHGAPYGTSQVGKRDRVLAVFKILGDTGLWAVSAGRW